MRFNPFPQRIRMVLNELMDAYDDGAYPFVAGVMDGPQDDSQLPPNLPRGGIEEANYLFALCYYMLGATDSNTIAKGIAKLYEQHADTLFNWGVAATLSPDYIGRCLAEAGANFRSSEDEVPQDWVYNAQKLVADYGGDVRNVFAEARGSWRQLYRLLINTKHGGFMGYGPKMASMLAFFFMRNNVVPYFMVPPQVDFHVMRVFWSNNLVLVFNQLDQEVQVLRSHEINRFGDAVRTELEHYLLHTRKEWTGVSEALWVLSRTLCSDCPSNSMSRNKEEKIFRKPVRWTKNQVDKYKRSCGVCPIESHCTQAIPSMFYYDRKEKKLVVYGPRLVPPQTELAIA